MCQRRFERVCVWGRVGGGGGEEGFKPTPQSPRQPAGPQLPTASRRPLAAVGR